MIKIKDNKTLFRIAIQEFVDGKPKKFSNVIIKEGDSLEIIHKKIDEKLISHLFKTKNSEVEKNEQATIYQSDTVV